jgi:hypothetical protein
LVLNTTNGVGRSSNRTYKKALCCQRARSLPILFA